MKRLALSFGLSLGIATAAGMAQETGSRSTLPESKPRAALGVPRAASLATPRAAVPDLVPLAATPAQYVPPPSGPFGLEPEPTFPSLDDSGPKKMPEGKEGPKLGIEKAKEKAKPVEKSPEMKSAAPPALSSVTPSYPAICDTPGCALTGAGSLPYDSRIYSSAEFLLWWTKSYSVPVIATTGPVGSGGVIGNAGVMPILGGNNLDPTGRPGVRVGLGWWCGENRLWGIDTSFFLIGDRGSDVSVGSGEFPLIARPFVAPNTLVNPTNRNLNIPGNFAEIVSLPNVQTGIVNLHTDSIVWGGDFALRRKLIENCDCHLDLLFGYRHLNLRENLEITEAIRGVPGSAADGLGAVVYDQFHTSNRFNGGLLGLLYERQIGRWSIGVNTKIGIGSNNSSVDIQGGLGQFGASRIQPTVPGGLLALNSNIGHYEKDRFTVVPEVAFNVGYDVTERCRLFVGYNFIYWSNVMRPGDQIDTTLDLTRVPILNDPNAFPQIANVRPATANRPAPMMKDSDLWLQGVNLGLRLKW